MSGMQCTRSLAPASRHTLIRWMTNVMEAFFVTKGEGRKLDSFIISYSFIAAKCSLQGSQRHGRLCSSEPPLTLWPVVTLGPEYRVAPTIGVRGRDSREQRRQPALRRVQTLFPRYKGKPCTRQLQVKSPPKRSLNERELVSRA